VQAAAEKPAEEQAAATAAATAAAAEAAAALAERAAAAAEASATATAPAEAEAAAAAMQDAIEVAGIHEALEVAQRLEVLEVAQRHAAIEIAAHEAIWVAERHEALEVAASHEEQELTQLQEALEMVRGQEELKAAGAAAAQNTWVSIEGSGFDGGGLCTHRVLCGGGTNNCNIHLCTVSSTNFHHVDISLMTMSDDPLGRIEASLVYRESRNIQKTWKFEGSLYSPFRPAVGKYPPPLPLPPCFRT
jgi:hypothetical protein